METRVITNPQTLKDIANIETQTYEQAMAKAIFETEQELDKQYDIVKELLLSLKHASSMLHASGGYNVSGRQAALEMHLAAIAKAEGKKCQHNWVTDKTGLVDDCTKCGAVRA